MSGAGVRSKHGNRGENGNGGSLIVNAFGLLRRGGRSPAAGLLPLVLEFGLPSEILRVAAIGHLSQLLQKSCRILARNHNAAPKCRVKAITADFEVHLNVAA
jgi:hypothetical protein